jgi:hypothetical protein
MMCATSSPHFVFSKAPADVSPAMRAPSPPPSPKKEKLTAPKSAGGLY